MTSETDKNHRAAMSKTALAAGHGAGLVFKNISTATLKKVWLYQRAMNTFGDVEVGESSSNDRQGHAYSTAENEEDEGLRQYSESDLNEKWGNEELKSIKTISENLMHIYNGARDPLSADFVRHIFFKAYVTDTQLIIALSNVNNKLKAVGCLTYGSVMTDKLYADLYDTEGKSAKRAKSDEAKADKLSNAINNRKDVCEISIILTAQNAPRGTGRALALYAIAQIASKKLTVNTIANYRFKEIYISNADDESAAGQNREAKNLFKKYFNFEPVADRPSWYSAELKNEYLKKVYNSFDVGLCPRRSGVKGLTLCV
jgi:hypothetical protein